VSPLVELLIKLLEKLLKTPHLSHVKKRRGNPAQAFIDGALAAFFIFEIILISLLIAFSIVHAF